MYQIRSCYQFVKDKNFESNSQPAFFVLFFVFCCYQFVKDKNFESNSQLLPSALYRRWSCYQFVKDKNFESNSQPVGNDDPDLLVVINLSKIKISKAIHNKLSVQTTAGIVVINLSKIKISKAIHNRYRVSQSDSKLLSICQR